MTEYLPEDGAPVSACRSRVPQIRSTLHYVGTLAFLPIHYVIQRQWSCSLDEETTLYRYRGRQGRRGSRDRPDIFGECVPLRAQPYRSVTSHPSRSYALMQPVVFLFKGYTRIILAALSLHYMSYHPKYCTVLYCISCLLDAFDGHAARALGQASKFGAVLDMVTDR